jgi:hypothetical protein
MTAAQEQASPSELIDGRIREPGGWRGASLPKDDAQPSSGAHAQLSGLSCQHLALPHDTHLQKCLDCIKFTAGSNKSLFFYYLSCKMPPASVSYRLPHGKHHSGGQPHVFACA